METVTIGGKTLRVGWHDKRAKHVGLIPIDTLKAYLERHHSLRAYGLTLTSAGRVDTLETEIGQRYYIGKR